MPRKTMFAAIMLTIATSATAQTTTTCNADGIGGVVCQSVPTYSTPAPAPQLDYARPQTPAISPQAYELQLREQALRDREMRLREREAGIANPKPPSRLRRALLGF